MFSLYFYKKRGMFMKYHTILFDLDGTLTNPKEGITQSVVYALSYFGIDVPDRNALCRFIGPPLVYSFMEYYGMDREQADTAIAKYRERFSVKGLYENELYPGVLEMLSLLKNKGMKLVLATSKPTVFAVRILEYFKLTAYFDFIAGAELDGSRDKKGDVIRYALEQAGVADGNAVLMVGDRLHDIEGAKENGLDAMGVLYGFGSREELEAAGADYIAQTVAEIPSIILCQ